MRRPQKYSTLRVGNGSQAIEPTLSASAIPARGFGERDAHDFDGIAVGSDAQTDAWLQLGRLDIRMIVNTQAMADFLRIVAPPASAAVRREREFLHFAHHELERVGKGTIWAKSDLG